MSPLEKEILKSFHWLRWKPSSKLNLLSKFSIRKTRQRRLKKWIHVKLCAVWLMTIFTVQLKSITKLKRIEMKWWRILPQRNWYKFWRKKVSTDRLKVSKLSISNFWIICSKTKRRKVDYSEIVDLLHHKNINEVCYIVFFLVISLVLLFLPLTVLSVRSSNDSFLGTILFRRVRVACQYRIFLPSFSRDLHLCLLFQNELSYQNCCL